MLNQCTSCRREVPNGPDNRRLPWCPSCGGDLKAGPPTPAPAAVAAAPDPVLRPRTEAAPAPAAPVLREQLPLPDVANLGTPEQVYPASPFRQLACWLCGLVCFGLAGLIGYGVLNQPDKSPDAGLGLIGLALLGGFACLYYALKLRELSYLVYPEALVEKRGNETRVIPWDRVREIYQTCHPAWKTYRIVTRMGSEILLTANIKNYLALGDQVEEKVTALLLPAAQANLEQGQTLRFGPLDVSRAALQFDGYTCGWHQVSMTVGLNPEPVQGNMRSNLMHLHIYSPVRTKAFKVEIGKIPNYRLLVELVRQRWPQCLPPEG